MACKAASGRGNVAIDITAQIGMLARTTGCAVQRVCPCDRKTHIVAVLMNLSTFRAFLTFS